RLLELRPPSDRQTAKAVRHEDHRAVRLVDREVEPVHPGVAMRVVPIAQIDPLAVAALAFPARLPMLWTAVVDARHDEDQRIPAQAGIVEFKIMSHCGSPSRGRWAVQSHGPTGWI